MTPGIYPAIKMADYLAIQAFSSGIGERILSQSPLHAWTDSAYDPNRERGDSGTADIGTYAHAMLLEGGTDALCIVDAADWRTKAAQQARDDARATGKTPILIGKVEEVKAMVAAAKSYLYASELSGVFDSGAPEQTIVFETDSVLCKARPDWLTESRKISLSYKTTAGSANPDQWIRTQLPGYDIGIVLYERAIKAVSDVQSPRVITLVQEQKKPYSCSLIGLSPAWQEMAEARLTLALATWRACLDEGKFPSYPNRICYAEPKPWQLAELLENEEQALGKEYDISKLWQKPE